MVFCNYGKPKNHFFIFSAPSGRENMSKSTVLPPLPPFTTFLLCCLTETANCAIIYPLKAAMKTCAKVRFSERKPLGARLLYPCFCDTTFEPWVGNVPPGAPVKASMSDGLTAVTRVEPWNTFVSHP